MFTWVNMKMTAEGRYSKELKKASSVIVKIAEILRSILALYKITVLATD